MTKDVLLSINGLHGFEEENSVEMITVGEYHKKNDKHYVMYEEYTEEKDTVKNTLKFNRDMVEIIKKGQNNVHMVFEEKKKNMTYYSTPFGDLLIGIFANAITVNEEDNNINIKISYSLEINEQHVSDSIINMSIKPRTAESINLSE